MKKLILKTVEYKKLLLNFGRYLKIKGYSKSTVYNAPNSLKEFLHYQEKQSKRLIDWQIQDYTNFIAYLKTRPNQRKTGALSGSHINKIIQALNLAQDYLKTAQQLHIYKGLEQVKVVSKTPKYFSKAEIEHLYNCCTGNVYGLRMRAVLNLCYGCGLRKSEAINLNLEDIWWDKKLVQVRKSKTNKDRLVPINTKVAKDLQAYLSSARPLLVKDKKQAAFLVSNRAERLTSYALYACFKTFLKKAQMPLCGLHSLRHSIATHLAASGMKSEQIAQFLGHQSLDSTQIYVQQKNV